MTSPIRILCNRASEIPSAEEIQTKIGRDYHMVLQFPLKLRVDKRSIITNLAAAMPDYSVFDSGGDKSTDWVTIKPVIAKATVLAHSEQITHAVMDYINTCSKMLELFEKSLLAEWTTDVHGEHVRLENKITRQEIEVPLGGAPEPREVDPYFFARFVKSTPGLESVAQLIGSDFHDAARMLNILFGPRSGG